MRGNGQDVTRLFAAVGKREERIAGETEAEAAEWSERSVFAVASCQLFSYFSLFVKATY